MVTPEGGESGAGMGSADVVPVAAAPDFTAAARPAADLRVAVILVVNWFLAKRLARTGSILEGDRREADFFVIDFEATALRAPTILMPPLLVQ